MKFDLLCVPYFSSEILDTPLMIYYNPLMKKHYFKIFEEFWSEYFRISRKSWINA